MKKIISALMLLFFMIPDVMAEWTPVGESDEDGGYTVYVDLVSALKAAGKAKMWILIDYKTEQKASGTSFLSKTIRRDYDCKEALVKQLAFKLFSLNMGKGELLRAYNQPQQWQTVLPESLEEAEWKAVCEQK
ncbi:MAG: hypothetical protein R3E36_11360 [Nitrosomonas sp.]|nr:hypothetical protein [Nitrosomonas sp.]MCP5251847.1 hypothetical protein [Burkholderiales bacterium]MDR4521170.1 hypothetical protein [Nitrosomonas sp.]HQU61525.1 hypothetical protein [Nitrosomonas sp.]